jgi:hypothetical protein
MRVCLAVLIIIIIVVPRKSTAMRGMPLTDAVATRHKSN